MIPKLMGKVVLLVVVMVMGSACSDKKSSTVSPNMDKQKSADEVPIPEHVLRSTIEVVEHPTK